VFSVVAVLLSILFYEPFDYCGKDGIHAGDIGADYYGYDYDQERQAQGFCARRPDNFVKLGFCFG